MSQCPDSVLGSLQCRKVYGMFCRHHLLVLIHIWPEVLTEPAVRPVGGGGTGTEGNIDLPGNGITANSIQPVAL